MKQSLWIILSNRVLISVFAFSKFYVVVLIFRVNCPFNPKLRTDYYDRCSQELISIYSLGGVTQESHQTQKTIYMQHNYKVCITLTIIQTKSTSTHQQIQLIKSKNLSQVNVNTTGRSTFASWGKKKKKK